MMERSALAAAATFQFNTKFDRTILLGKKARNVAALGHGVRTVPDGSIYFHTHKFLQQHHYLSPEPPNDFAYWTTHVLNEATLGEQLSSVDIIQFHSITALWKAKPVIASAVGGIPLQIAHQYSGIQTRTIDGTA